MEMNKIYQEAVFKCTPPYEKKRLVYAACETW